VKVIGYEPIVPAAGVPLSVAVPFALSLKVTPAGSAPVPIRDGTGNPVVVTVKVPAAPTAKAVLLALVIAGASLIMSVKFCVALPKLLVAVTAIVYVLPVPATGVPLNVAVRLWLSTNVTPLGSAPVSVKTAVGKPTVVTVKLPAVPTVNVVLFELEMAGA